MDNNKAAKALKIVSTVFLPLSVVSVSLLAVIGYVMVWVGSSGSKKRYYRIAAMLYLIDAALSPVKLYLSGHIGIMGRSFAAALFGSTALTIFWIAAAVVMAIQGILSVRAAKSCTDNGRFFE
ncbi:MAG: hypothetical protein IKR73_06440 [Oscillospiraceae bacterium]|nr:hypothetical protein [Oscillospiraceae bacterium]